MSTQSSNKNKSSTDDDGGNDAETRDTDDFECRQLRAAFDSAAFFRAIRPRKALNAIARGVEAQFANIAVWPLPHVAALRTIRALELAKTLEAVTGTVEAW